MRSPWRMSAGARTWKGAGLLASERLGAHLHAACPAPRGPWGRLQAGHRWASPPRHRGCVRETAGEGACQARPGDCPWGCHWPVPGKAWAPAWAAAASAGQVSWRAERHSQAEGPAPRRVGPRGRSVPVTLGLAVAAGWRVRGPRSICNHGGGSPPCRGLPGAPLGLPGREMAQTPGPDAAGPDVLLDRLLDTGHLLV